MGYNLPHHLEYNLETNHFEVSDNVLDVTFVSGTLAVVATATGIEAFPYNQFENYGYITMSGGFNRIDHAYDYIYARDSASEAIYRTTVSELRAANGSPSSLVKVYPLEEINNWGNIASDYAAFNVAGTNTITISGGLCVITDTSPVTDKAFVSYGRQLKPPFSIKNRIKITNINYDSASVIDSLLSISHSTTGINTGTQGSLRASFYIYVESSSSAKIGLYYNDGTDDWYWDAGNNEWDSSDYSVPFNYNVYNTFYTVELVVTADWKVTFNVYNSAETLLESISTTDDHTGTGGGEKISSSSILWGWFGDNRDSTWILANINYCTYHSDYFNIHPYWVAYEPVINDFDVINIETDSYLGVACGDSRAGKTGRALVIKNEHLLDEYFADCQVVKENSYDPRFIRFADGDVYYQLGTGSNSRLYGIMDFWTNNNILVEHDVQFNPETGLIFDSTINDMVVYSGTSYNGAGNSIFTATDEGAVVIYQHRTNFFSRDYFSLGHENVVMHDSFIDYNIGAAPDCWTSTVNDSDTQSIRVLYDTGDYYYGASDDIGGISQVDKSSLAKVRDIVTSPANKGCQSIVVDDQFVWVSYKSAVDITAYFGVVRHIKDSTDYDIVHISEWDGNGNVEIEGTMGVDLTHVYVAGTRPAYVGYDYPTLAKIDKFSLNYEFFELTGSGIPSSAGKSIPNETHNVYGVAVDADYVYVLDFCDIGTWDEGPHLIRWNKSTEQVDKVLPNLGDGSVVYSKVAHYIYLDSDYLYFSWGLSAAGPIKRINKNMESSTMEDAGVKSRDICVGENIVYGVPLGSYTVGGFKYIVGYFVYKNNWSVSEDYYYRLIEWVEPEGSSEDAYFRVVSMDSNSLYASRFPVSKKPYNLRVDYHFVTAVKTGIPPYTDAVFNTPSIHHTFKTIGDMTGYDFGRTFGSVSENKMLEMSDLSTSNNINFKRHFKDIAVNDNYVVKFKAKLKRYNPFYMALKYNGDTALEFRWTSVSSIEKKIAPCSGTSWKDFSISSGTYSKSSWHEYKIEAFVPTNSFNFYIDDVKYESTVSGSFCNNVSSLNEIVFYTDSGEKQLAYIDGVSIYDYDEVAEDYSTEIDYPVFHGITNKSKSLVRTFSYNHDNTEVLVYNYDPVFGGSISQVNLNVSNAFSDGVCLYAYYSTSAPMGPEQIDMNKIGVFNIGESVSNITEADRIWAAGNFGMNMFDKWDATYHVESIHINDISYNYNKKEVACGTKGGIDILSLISNGLSHKAYISLPHGCSTIYNSDRGIYFATACSGVLFLADDDYTPYTDSRELSLSVQKLFSVGERNLSNNMINCIHATNDGENLLISTESGVDFITYNIDTSYAPTEYAQYGFSIPQGSDKCFITPTGSCYYNVRGEGLAVSYAAPSASGTLYDDVEADISSGGNKDLTIGRGVHIKWRNNIWNDYMKGQRLSITHDGLIHKVKAYVKRVGSPDPLRCSIYDSVADGTPSSEQVYTEVSGIDASYSWVEFNLPYYRAFVSNIDPWVTFTQSKMDWNNYYVIRTTDDIDVYTTTGGQGNKYDLTTATGTWGFADNWSIEWAHIYVKVYLSDRWNTAGLWSSWDHIYTTSGTPALISSNINDIYVYEGASDYSINQNWNKIYLATDSGVQIIDERRTDITLSKSTTIGVEGGTYDYNLMKGLTYNSTAVWNLEEEGNFYVGTNDGFEGGAFNAMNFSIPIFLKDYLTTDEGYGLVPSLDLFSNNINDLEVIYLSGLRAATI